MSATSGSSVGSLRSPGVKPVASRFPLENAITSGLRVLVVDSDGMVQDACRELSARLGLNIRAVDSLAAAQTILLKQPVDLLLLDLNLKDNHGVQQFEGLRASHPEMAIVIATASATVESAVQALRMGASDFPGDAACYRGIQKRAGARFETQDTRGTGASASREGSQIQLKWNALVGHSPAMQKLYRVVSKVAFSNHPVLIVGESGTGKELVARTIHSNGPNANRPFVPIYCNSMGMEALERELFGYARGAFPEATRAKAGLFLEADSGNGLFRWGRRSPTGTAGQNSRVCCRSGPFAQLAPETPFLCTPVFWPRPTRNLANLQAHGEFRRDLYFRLNVVNIHVPKLAERRDDIPVLADQILRRIRQETERPYELGTDAKEMLLAYHWPGNVRELESALERACVMASSPFLTPNDFPSQIQQKQLHGDDHAWRPCVDCSKVAACRFDC